jgi:hypothetical protein
VESGTWYPNRLKVGPAGTPQTVEFLKSTFPKTYALQYAEFGFYKGATALQIVEHFPHSDLFLFDYESAVENVQEKFSPYGQRVNFWASSQKFLDSYNWSLMKIIMEKDSQPIFDYCFLDGAHTFAIDALAFFLIDRCLRVGGYVDFDDYSWRLQGSSLDPINVPETALMYTDEQISSRQLKILIDHIVKKESRYEEIVQNKIFKKIS